MLSDLDIPEGTALMLVSPPDGVLAEAAKRSPRPSIASSIMTAEPTAVLAWWPEGDALNDGTIAKLKWMVEMARGTAWLVLDPREGTPPANDVEAMAAGQSLRVMERRELGGETALRLGEALDQA